MKVNKSVLCEHSKIACNSKYLPYYIKKYRRIHRKNAHLFMWFNFCQLLNLFFCRPIFNYESSENSLRLNAGALAMSAIGCRKVTGFFTPPLVDPPVEPPDVEIDDN